MTVLDEIFAYKRAEVERRKAETPLRVVRREAETRVPAIDFIAALREDRHIPALIAEVKRASPSRGVLVDNFDPLRLARTYQLNGAAAISVLTDEHFFMGSLKYLCEIAGAFDRDGPRLPMLRKDFIYDPYQVYEARAAGADAVLLITAALELDCLGDLHAIASELHMAALVEVHDRKELDSVLRFSPRLIGINNRDLRDFSVRLETTLDLRQWVPENVCLVSESGIHTRQDVLSLAGAGVDAILVGEALVTAADVPSKIRSLIE